MIRFFVPGNPRPWRRAGTSNYFRTKDGGLKRREFPVHFDRVDPTWTSMVFDMVIQFRQTPLLDGPLRVAFFFTLLKPKSKPKKKIYPDVKPDLDNLSKQIEDICEGIIYRNDAQICQYYLEKKYGDPPGVEVRIEPL